PRSASPQPELLLNSSTSDAKSIGTPLGRVRKSVPAILFRSLRTGRNFTLSAASSVRLGRETQCDIYLADDTVSRAHAELQLDPQTKVVEVRDLGSTNGTYLNDSAITKAVAKVGDYLRFGNSTFELVVADD